MRWEQICVGRAKDRVFRRAFNGAKKRYVIQLSSARILDGVVQLRSRSCNDQRDEGVLSFQDLVCLQCLKDSLFPFNACKEKNVELVAIGGSAGRPLLKVVKSGSSTGAPWMKTAPWYPSMRSLLVNSFPRTINASARP